MSRVCRSDAPASFVSAVAGGVTLLVLVAAFSLHALDVTWAWIAYPLGFGGLLPVALGWAGRAAAQEAEPAPLNPQAEALDRLRERYAMGEIDEVEFERRVEAVLAPTTEPQQ